MIILSPLCIFLKLNQYWVTWIMQRNICWTRSGSYLITTSKLDDTCYRLGEYEQAIKYDKNIINCLNKSFDFKNTRVSRDYLVKLMSNLEKGGAYEEEIKVGLNLSRLVDNNDDIAEDEINEIYEKLANAYYLNNNYSEAARWLIKAVDMNNHGTGKSMKVSSSADLLIGNKEKSMQQYDKIALYLFMDKKYDEAIKYVNLSKRMPFFTDDHRLYDKDIEISTINFKKGDIHEAVRYAKGAVKPIATYIRGNFKIGRASCR